MVNRIKLSCACAVLALAVSGGTSLAADLPPPPPPPVEVVEGDSCFYVSAGGSYITHERPRVYKNTAGPWGQPNADNEDFTDTGAIDAGIGCRVADGLRLEFNAGYRFENRLTSPSGLDADYSAFTGMWNAWWDITNIGGFKPYVGGGVGFAVHRTDSALPVGSTGKRTDTTMTWQVGAGIGIDVTDNLTVDVGYRFTDLGLASSAGATPYFIDDNYSHEFRIGLRYDFNGLM
ncbi:MAG: porin family protein [Rhizobiales bacterium]|nr:porin family protein [Hyphomicrobiales bacterium]